MSTNTDHERYECGPIDDNQHYSKHTNRWPFVVVAIDSIGALLHIRQTPQVYFMYDEYAEDQQHEVTHIMTAFLCYWYCRALTRYMCKKAIALEPVDKQ
eukprot:14605-Heterococcus_DN1.PRE.1